MDLFGVAYLESCLPVISFLPITLTTPPLSQAAKFPTIDSFYAYLLHRVSVTFRRLNEPKEDACVLELSRRMTYDEVCAKLGAATELDGEKLRLTAHNSYTKVPKPFPIHRTNRITNAQITLNEVRARNVVVVSACGVCVCRDCIYVGGRGLGWLLLRSMFLVYLFGVGSLPDTCPDPLIYC